MSRKQRLTVSQAAGGGGGVERVSPKARGLRRFRRGSRPQTPSTVSPHPCWPFPLCILGLSHLGTRIPEADAAREKKISYRVLVLAWLGLFRFSVSVMLHERELVEKAQSTVFPSQSQQGGHAGGSTGPGGPVPMGASPGTSLLEASWRPAVGTSLLEASCPGISLLIPERHGSKGS